MSALNHAGGKAHWHVHVEYLGFEFRRNFGRREEQKLGSDGQKQKYVDGSGEVEGGLTKKQRRRGYVVLVFMRPTCNGQREDDERICQWITKKTLSVVSQETSVRAHKSIPKLARLCAYSAF